MSSISPIETKRFARQVNELGGDYLDAPVSGGEIGAREGTLAFHEVLDGITTAEQFAEILTENGGIKFIAFKSTANKERPQTAENRPGRPEVQDTFSAAAVLPIYRSS